MKFYQITKTVLTSNLILLVILIILSLLNYVKLSLILSTAVAFIFVLLISFIYETITFVNKRFGN